MKYKLNPTTRSDMGDMLWLGFVVVILLVITVYGYDILAYVSTHNILKGEF